MKKIIIFINLIFLTLATQTSFAILLQQHVTGVSDDLLKNIESRLAILQGDSKQQLTADRIDSIYDQAPSEIQQALAPFGYPNPHIQRSLSKNHAHWVARYHVTPGTPIIIQHLDFKITGAALHDPAFIHLTKHLLIRPGTVFNAEHYEDTKHQLFALASTRGYFQARLSQNQIRINKTSHRASITLHFQSGPRSHFGPVHISQSPFNKSFIRRFLTFQPGDPYNSEKLEGLQHNLVTSNYFETVTVTPQHKQSQKLAIPITVDLKARKAKFYQLGLGYGTDDGGPRATLGLDWRYLNAEGHHFQAYIKGAKRYHYATADYFIPLTNPLTDVLRFSAAYQHENSTQGEGSNVQLGVSYVKMLYGIQQTVSLTGLSEYSNLENAPKRSSRIIMPSGNWLWRNSNDLLRPTQGYRLNVNLRGAGKGLGSGFSFIQTRLDTVYMHPIWPTSRFIVRGSLAYTDIDDIETLPFTLQYFAGGAQSVRGYQFQELGPGKYLSVGSVELQQKIYGDWYLGGFYDVGSVNNKFAKELKRGTGVSLTWLSPVGPLRLSIATPLDRKPGSKKWRIQFTMGPEL